MTFAPAAAPIVKFDAKLNGTSSLELPRPLVRQQPAADPFPLAALGSLAPAADAIHDRTQAPIAICGQSVLAAATLAVQGHADVVLPTGQARPISNFFVTIGVSGERKSAVDYEALRPVRKFETRLRESYELDRANYTIEKFAFDKAKDDLSKKGKGDKREMAQAMADLGVEPSLPLIPLLTCDEPTIEGLIKTFEKGRPSLGIFSAEGGGFVSGHAMSDDARIRTATGLSNIWDGVPIKRVRGGDGVTILPGRRATMHLMVQPQVANVMLANEQLSDQGLLSRMLVTEPQSTIGKRFWREQDQGSDAALQRYNAGILSALERSLPLVEGQANELEPRPLPLAGDARELWIRFSDHMEGEVGFGGSLSAIPGRVNKLAEVAARLAATLALFDDIETREVSSSHMAAGIELASHYAAEGLRLHEGAQVGDDLRRAQRLLEWLLAWPEPMISAPDVYQLGPGDIRDQATAKRLIRILEDHVWLVRVPGGGTVGGKKRQDVWSIRKDVTQ